MRSNPGYLLKSFLLYHLPFLVQILRKKFRSKRELCHQFRIHNTIQCQFFFGPIRKLLFADLIFLEKSVHVRNWKLDKVVKLWCEYIATKLYCGNDEIPSRHVFIHLGQAHFLCWIIKPNYFKKQSSLSSFLKFMFSKKATKYDEIFTTDLTFTK